MKYVKLRLYDMANGPGVRVTIFVSGCRHHCVECFNPEICDFSYGDDFTDCTIKEIIKQVKHHFIEGLSILGGEPFEPENISGVLNLLVEFNDHCSSKSVWCYTGYKFEELLKGRLVTKDRVRVLSDLERNLILGIINRLNVLVDGEFYLTEKNIRLPFCSSSNQRVIDVQKSLKMRKVVLYNVKS